MDQTQSSVQLPLPLKNFDEMSAAIDVLRKNIQPYKATKFTQAAHALLSKGQEMTRLYVRAMSEATERKFLKPEDHYNPFSIVLTLTELWDKQGRNLLQDGEARYLLARTLRLFSELALLLAKREKDDLDIPPPEKIDVLTGQLTGLVTEVGNSSSLKFELQCAKAACKAWKPGQAFWKDYVPRVARVVVDAFTLELGEALKALPSIFIDLTQDAKQDWYGKVFTFSIANGSQATNHFEAFRSVHEELWIVHQELIERSGSLHKVTNGFFAAKKVMLGAIDLFAYLIWRGSPDIRTKALRGWETDVTVKERKCSADLPGLLKLAEVMPRDPSKRLIKWLADQTGRLAKSPAGHFAEIRIHACCHLRALMEHPTPEIARLAREALQRRRSDPDSSVSTRAKDLLDRESMGRLNAYRSYLPSQIPSLWEPNEIYELCKLIPNLDVQLKELREQGEELIQGQKELRLGQKDTSDRLDDTLDKLVRIDQKLPELPQKPPPSPTDLPSDFPGYIERAGLQQDLVLRLLPYAQDGLTLTPCLGMGGVGKTSLVEFVIDTDRIKRRYPVRLYFRDSDVPGQLESQFNTLAKKWENRFDDDIEPREAVRRVIERLEGGEPYLIFFDNVDGRDSLEDYLPKRGGHVVITTPNPAWPNPLVIDVLGEKQAIALARRTLPREFVQDNEQDIPALCREMGYHPLGLKHACGYLITNKLATVAEFLERLKESNHSFVEGKRSLHGETLPKSISGLWEMTFAKLGDSSPARQLLDRLAYVAPEAIPLPLIRALVGEDRADEALKTLVPHNLLKESNGEYTIHRLLQRVLRSKLLKNSVLEHTIARFAAICSESGTRDTNEKLLAHGQALISHIDEDVSLESQALIFEGVGRIQQGIAQYRPALKNLLRAFKVQQGIDPPDNPKIRDALSSLAAVSLALGDRKEAINYYSLRLASAEKEYGPKDPRLVFHLMDLGNAIGDSEHQQAQAYFEQVVAIGEQCPDIKAEPALQVTYYLFRADAYKSLGPLQGLLQAEALCRLAFDLVERTNEIEITIKHRCQKLLASVLRRLGRIEEAIEHGKIVLKLVEEKYGHGHPQVAEAYWFLGRCYRQLKDYTQSISCFKQCLNIHEQVYGKRCSQHYRRISYLTGLALAQREEGNVTAARISLQAACDMAIAIHGSNSSETRMLFQELENLNKPGFPSVFLSNDELNQRSEIFGPDLRVRVAQNDRAVSQHPTGLDTQSTTQAIVQAQSIPDGQRSSKPSVRFDSSPRSAVSAVSLKPGKKQKKTGHSSGVSETVTAVFRQVFDLKDENILGGPLESNPYIDTERWEKRPLEPLEPNPYRPVIPVRFDSEGLETASLLSERSKSSSSCCSRCSII